MVALDVERRRVLAGGEGGRIDDGEREPLRARAGLLEEAPRVGGDEGMVALETVQPEVVLRPAQIGRRGVDGDGAARSSPGRGAGERPRVAEEVQERRAAALLADAATGLAVIGKEPRVEMIVEVDEKSQRSLTHLEARSGPCEPFVAGALRGTRAAAPQMQVLLGDAERRRRRPRNRRKPSRNLVRLFSRVFGDDQVAFVPVRDGPDLGDVPVVDAEGADTVLLETRMQSPERLPHPVREHLRLAGDVHGRGQAVSPAAKRAAAPREAPPRSAKSRGRARAMTGM